MMKQTEDAGEKMGVGTWVDLLSGACRIPLLIPFIISGFSLFLLRSLASISLLLIFGRRAYSCCVALTFKRLVPPVLLRTSTHFCRTWDTLDTDRRVLTRQAARCLLSQRLFGAYLPRRGRFRLSMYFCLITCILLLLHNNSCTWRARWRWRGRCWRWRALGSSPVHISLFFSFFGLLCYRSCAFLQFAAGGG
jgi:hypothetical protein